MRGLTAAELLDVWERGHGLPPVRRAFVLLRAACPDETADALVTWTVGRRDAHLFRLRELTLGPDLNARATCAECGAALELAFRVADVRAPFADPATPSYEAAGHAVRFRLPTLRDLDEAVVGRDPATARERLLRACVLDTPVPVELLPDEVLAAVERQMEEADPQAAVRLALACDPCGRGGEVTFDIAAFFWAEITAHALRLVREVHTLAAAYGWAEADILNLTPSRRAQYLELAGA